MISVKGEVKMELSLKEAIKIVNDYAGRQVKQYDEAEDLLLKIYLYFLPILLTTLIMEGLLS